MVDQPSAKQNRHPATRGFAVGLAPLFALMGAVAVLNPSAQLERGLSTAAAAEAVLIAEAVRTDRPTTVVASRPPEEGSEAFWLTRAPDAENMSRVAWTAPVAAGDRVVVNFGAYNREMIDVISVDEKPALTTRIDTSVNESDRYVVTGRRLAEPDAPLIRLTVDAEGRGLTMGTGGPDRAL